MSVATGGVFVFYCIEDRVRPGKSLLVASRPLIISFIDLMDIKEMAIDSQYDLAAAIIAWEAVNAVSWLAVSPISAVRWLFYSFTRGEMSLFPTPGNVRDIVRGV